MCLLSRRCVTFLRWATNSTQTPGAHPPVPTSENRRGEAAQTPGPGWALPSAVWEAPEPPPLKGTEPRGEWGRSGATPVRQGFPTGVTPPKPVDHWEQRAIGSSLPVAYFKSAGLHPTAAYWCLSLKQRGTRRQTFTQNSFNSQRCSNTWEDNSPFCHWLFTLFLSQLCTCLALSLFVLLKY